MYSDEFKLLIKQQLGVKIDDADEISVAQKNEYPEYLKSNLWKRIKRRVLKRDGKVCQLCAGPGNVVHHRSYDAEVLQGQADYLLVTLCEGCHCLVHFDDSGQKRTAADVHRICGTFQLQREFSEPTVDLRLRSRKNPNGWERLTAVQRRLWQERHIELKSKKLVSRGHLQYQ
jgi:5-methylcytosine-specific restriction endonuclease McrA